MFWPVLETALPHPSLTLANGTRIPPLPFPTCLHRGEQQTTPHPQPQEHTHTTRNSAATRTQVQRSAARQRDPFDVQLENHCRRLSAHHRNGQHLLVTGSCSLRQQGSPHPLCRVHHCIILRGGGGKGGGGGGGRCCQPGLSRQYNLLKWRRSSVCE